MSQLLKVAYLLGSINRGGAETMMLDLFNQSGNNSFEMIGIYRYDGEMSQQFLTSVTPLMKISPGPGLQLWNYIRQLRKLVKQNGVSIIHSNQCLDTIYGVIASFGLGIKVFQTVHGFDFDSSMSVKILKYVSFKLAYKTIFVSNTQKEYYTSKYSLKSGKEIVVYNGIDFNKFSSQRHTDLRRFLNIEEDTFLMGTIGNFSPGKDHMTICRFLKHLNQEKINFCFLFIGKKIDSYPDLYEDCHTFCMKNGLKDKTRFLGSREDIADMLPMLNAFIFSTRHDAFGIALIEAIASGLPVFANDWDVIKEITESGKRAVLYQSNNEFDLFDKFMDFHIHPDPFLEKARVNAIWARDKYNIQLHIRHLHQIYSTKD